jgi:hypothetical protein
MFHFENIYDTIICAIIAGIICYALFFGYQKITGHDPSYWVSKGLFFLSLTFGFLIFYKLFYHKKN